MEQIQNPAAIRRDRLRLAGHGFVGLAIVMEGISRIGVPEENWPFSLFCFVAAVLLVLSVVYHERLKPLLHDPHAIPLVIEAVLAFVLGFKGLGEGKVFLPWAWFAAGSGGAIAAVVMVIRSANRVPAPAAEADPVATVLPADRMPDAAAQAEAVPKKKAQGPRKKSAVRKNVKAGKKPVRKSTPAVRKKKPSPKRGRR